MVVVNITIYVKKYIIIVFHIMFCIMSYPKDLLIMKYFTPSK
jgi:hypothetical protein